ncbi:hypothetical protein JR316_0011581 [Psilocybe cubensis]|uniref:Uncharacterized protein n=1 Tax=Psilocybe cubensis TaxID=181762 RepID=A0ACB8GJY4_PSICU|nr:hypothetical protein JR316_0011581 [Psilocybe cubensis]KAH9476013.1 hypothetical protein JR316_0011581 [Psilocybe cubensis]
MTRTIRKPNSAQPIHPPLRSRYEYPRNSCSQTHRKQEKLGTFWWRRRIWIESTFALTVYEPWEKVLVLTIFSIFCTAMLIVLVKYLPHQFIVMRRRAIYYIWGEYSERSELALWQYLDLARADSCGTGGASCA